MPGSERSWQGGRAALRPVGSCEFAEDFRENRCILQADRVVRPYGIWEVLKLGVGADASVGPFGKLRIRQKFS